MQWYYIKDGESQGPVDEKKIISMLSDGSMTPDDSVWNETFNEEWLPAGSVPAFAGVKKEEVASSLPVCSPPALPQVPINDRKHDNGPRKVSCVDVISPAIERMKDILFRPFDIAKWFALGFSAFLATLGEGGGGGNGGSGGGNSNPDFDAFDTDVIADMFRKFIAEYPWVIPLVIGVVIIFLMVGVLVTWLSARGKFMFLDNVVTNRDRISGPWNEFKRLGNSLFLWSFVFGFVRLLVFAALAAVAYFSVLKPCIDADAFVRSTISGIIFVGITVVLVSIVFAYVSRFLNDFVVPIMYKQNLSTMKAWGCFLSIMKPAKGTFFLYGLFYALLTLGAGMVVMLCILLTCCIALCPLVIPYVGAVMMLPITVFFRAYSLEYLAQFGEEYDVLKEAEEGLADETGEG